MIQHDGKKISDRSRLPFNSWLKDVCEPHGVSRECMDAMIFVHDTLDSADVIAHSIFGPDASDETVLAVFDRLVVSEGMKMKE